MYIQNKKVFLKELGSIAYKAAWDFQEKLMNDIIRIKKHNRTHASFDPTPNYFLFVTHPNVYTLGKSGNVKHLLLSEKRMLQKGISFYKTNRGGDITYHGKGQIVGYPILDLENFFTDIHKYLRLLEEVIILTLDSYGIKTERSTGETGVWLEVGTPYARKICAMGVRCSRWVSMHGFALNVNTDLKYFDDIIPCGIKHKSVTSMQQELNEKIDESQVKKTILKKFEKVFQMRFV